jgi:DNA adenine methylase
LKGKIYCYDINEALINVYKHIQSEKESLMNHVEYYMNQYDELSGTNVNRKPQNIDEAKTSKESFYYWMRHLFNTIDHNTIEHSALFMCINKTCFRGMYREGPNGFNVPYGHYKKTPKIMTRDEVDHISNMIQNVVFQCCDFESALNNIEKDDFVYIDPPYAPENKTSFVGYVADGFTYDDHQRLFSQIKNMDESIKFVMSNAKVDLVLNSFQDYEYETIMARRAINSKKPDSMTNEVLVYN